MHITLASFAISGTVNRALINTPVVDAGCQIEACPPYHLQSDMLG